MESRSDGAGARVPSLDRDRLDAFIRRQLAEADEVSVSDITPAPGGVSREHFFFDLTWSRGGTREEIRLVLIRDGDRPGQTDRAAEFQLLRALEQTRIPVPRVYWCDTTGEILDRPFIVMERMGGAVTPPLQIPYADNPPLRQTLADEFVETLADLHLLDWRAHGMDFLETPGCALADVAGVAAQRLRSGVQNSGVVDSDPVIERGLAWCIEHAPRTQRWTLCHGDYKPDNILHEAGRIVSIVDWERARIGDPLADLGYVCVPHLRVGRLVCGLAEQEPLLRAYEQRTGFEVHPEAIQFWQVHLLLQTVLYFSALRADAERRGRDPAPHIKPLLAHLRTLIDETLGRSGSQIP